MTKFPKYVREGNQVHRIKWTERVQWIIIQLDSYLKNRYNTLIT